MKIMEEIQAKLVPTMDLGTALFSRHVVTSWDRGGLRKRFVTIVVIF